MISSVMTILIEAAKPVTAFHADVQRFGSIHAQLGIMVPICHVASVAIAVLHGSHVTRQYATSISSCNMYKNCITSWYTVICESKFGIP